MNAFVAAHAARASHMGYSLSKSLTVSAAMLPKALSSLSSSSVSMSVCAATMPPRALPLPSSSSMSMSVHLPSSAWGRCWSDPVEPLAKCRTATGRRAGRQPVAWSNFAGEMVAPSRPGHRWGSRREGGPKNHAGFAPWLSPHTRTRAQASNSAHSVPRTCAQTAASRAKASNAAHSVPRTCAQATAS